MSHETLFKLAMWETWQNKVKAALPNFAAHPIYVDQSQSEEEYQSVTGYVFRNLKRRVLDRGGMLRDAEFGARVVETPHGKLTRMWLDSNVEVDFLRRKFPHLDKARVLDIGAGYGRVAVTLQPLTDGCYVCVDPVPVSTMVCRQYCQRFAPTVIVPSLPDFLDLHNRRFFRFDLAINIHSWNECTREQISAWLDVLDEAKIPHLFTVSHGQVDGSIEQAYYAWEPGRPSWLPLVEERWEKIAEEHIGFSQHPHVLWKRK